MMPNTKIKLPSERSPSVIDIDVICEALGMDTKADSYDESAVSNKEEEAARRFLLKTSQTLRLEFRQILKVENLHCLTSLTRLFLDNNFIENMSGCFDQLPHLTWLDLSFNRIQKIEGLEALKKLEVLALFGNEIQHVENLEHLSELKVLRLGRNQIVNKEEITYLRKLQRLRTLSIKENPFCTDETWQIFLRLFRPKDLIFDYGIAKLGTLLDKQDYAIAILPNLSYLECHFVTSDRRDDAVSKHQGDIFRAQSQEESEKESFEKRRRELTTERRQKAAFVSSLKGETLLQALLSCNQEQEKLLKHCMDSWQNQNDDNNNNMDAIWSQFCQEMVDIGDAIYDLGLLELEAREKEVAVFEECVRNAQRSSQTAGIKEIDLFLEEKDRIFESVFELASQFEDKEPEEVTDLQREEVEKLRELFIIKTKDLWNTIMANEITLVNQIEQVLVMFEANLRDMINNFVECVKRLFVKARSVDVRYFKRLSELGEDIEEVPYEGGFGQEGLLGGLPEGVKVSGLIAQCHDGHQNLLLEEEERLQEAVNKWRDDFLGRFRKRERKRNRNRILELNHFVDTMRQEEEEELDVLPSNEYIGEDILLLE